MKKNIYIFTRCSWTFINFRHELVNKINKKKFNVFVCMDFDGIKQKYLEKKYSQINFININFLNRKKSFLLNFFIIFQIFKVFLNNKIHIAHNFTARPIIFVTLVSIFFHKTNIINTVTGLGNNFFSKNFFITIIYNIIFLKSKIIVFQNGQDKKILFDFVKRKSNIKIIYPNVKYNKQLLKIKNKTKKKIKKKIIFLMHSRMIEQKGVIEYVDAIKKIGDSYKKKSLFYLIGNPDNNNPSSISQKYLNNLNKNNDLIYLKHKKNIKEYILKSDVIVLPSYGEGLPASLLEAIFFKKAIITTRVNGCIEIVKNNYNGILVKPKNSKNIYSAIIKLIKSPKLIKRFKANSHKLYNTKFKKNSIRQYLEIYTSL